MTRRSARLLSLPGRARRRVTAHRAEQRLTKSIARLGVSPSRAPRHGGPTIAFAALDSGPWHLALEILLSHALQLRGAQCELLVCDLPHLPVCDERTACSASLERCAGCVHRTRPLLDAAGLSWQGLSAYVPPDAIVRATERVRAISDQALDSHVEAGWPVGQWLHVSMCHFLRRDARAEDAECVAAKRRHLASGIVLIEAVERWLDAIRPDHVVVESGAHLSWRIALELSKARGIPVTAREVGKGGWGRQIYALNADAMAPDLTDEWRAASLRPLSADEEREIDDFLERLPGHTFDQDYRAPRRSASDLRAGFSLPTDRKIGVAFTNVTWDLATAGRDGPFDGSLDWLRDTIEHTMADERWHLVVRGHPAEASVLTRERITDAVRREHGFDPGRVTFIEPEMAVSAADLCAVADVVLAYNSTAGLEAAARGSTVILGGRPHFGGKTFTIDVYRRSDYATLLQSVGRGEMVADRRGRDLARRYAHLFFFRYHVDMGLTSSPLTPPFEVTVSALTDLEQGRNPNLDLVCDGILGSRQIVKPARTLTASI